MLIAAQLVAALASLLHIVFFVFESVLWRRPAVYARFDIGTQAEADTIRPMAYNQGFYNLALAVGVIVGIFLLESHGGAFVAGKTLVIFGTGCMAVAGSRARLDRAGVSAGGGGAVRARRRRSHTHFSGTLGRRP